MDEWMDVARAWMVSEWERSPSQDIEVLANLRRSVVAYMQEINQAANNQLIRRLSNRGSSCGCDTCEEEEAAVRAEPEE